MKILKIKVYFYLILGGISILTGQIFNSWQFAIAGVLLIIIAITYLVGGLAKIIVELKKKVEKND